MSTGNEQKKIGLLFPGQGSQYPGMVKDLFDQYDCVKKLFQQAQKVTNIDCKELLFNSDANELKKTHNAQIAITLADLSCFSALKEEGLCDAHIAGIAGFSLGEYPALVAADVINTESCFYLIRHRGQIVQEYIDSLERKNCAGGMAAVLGLSPESVEKVLEISGQSNVFCANYNSPKQIVISGILKEIDVVEPQLLEAGATRVIRLAVSGPFHTPLLREAANSFVNILSGVQFRNPKHNIFSNVTGEKIISGEQVKKLLVEHIYSPVRWISIENELRKILGESFLVIESGPGRILTSLWRELGFNHSYTAGKYEEIIQACSLL